jgi:hypothetical protein
MLDFLSSAIGPIGAGIGGLMGLIGGLGQERLDYGQERKDIMNFANLAGTRSNEMYDYGKQFMDADSPWYRQMAANVGRQYDVMTDTMRNLAATGISSSSQYRRMLNDIQRKAFDSQSGMMADMYAQGVRNAANMFGLSKDWSGQQLNAYQIHAAMKEKENASKNAPYESFLKAGAGLLGTFGGQMLANQGNQYGIFTGNTNNSSNFGNNRASFYGAPYNNNNPYGY